MTTYRLHHRVEQERGGIRLALLVGRRDRFEPVDLDRQQAWDLALAILATLNAADRVAPVRAELAAARDESEESA